MKDRVVIIGNGIAALSAIKAFRTVDEVSEIHLFGEESYYPYNRIRLSKGLLNTLEEDNILLQKKEWYKANGVSIYIDKKAMTIDLSLNQVYFQDGSHSKYTKLLVATGASNMRPLITGTEKEGVLTLRNLKDAKNIIEKENESQVILNIGGGIQGLETAWILSQVGKRVIITELQPRLMPKQLDEKASKILEQSIKNKNIKVMLNTQVDELLGGDKINGFKMKDGATGHCDMALYAIGLSPNIAWLDGSGIKVNRGIIVNEKMETSIEGIYAAGDVAEVDDQIHGLWNMAIEQGKVAGYNLAGKEVKYKPIVPVTTLSGFGISIFSMGVIDEKQATDFIIWDQSDKNMYSKVLISNNKVVGAIVVGNTKISPIFKTAIENKVDLGRADFKGISIEEITEIIKQNK